MGLLSDSEIAEDDGAAPEDDGGEADIEEDADEVEPASSEVSQSPPHRQRTTTSKLLDGAEYAAALLGGVPSSEFTLPAVAKLGRLIHARLLTPLVEEPERIEEAIDLLDVGLSQGVKNGLWKLSQLQAAIPSMRAATRLVLELASTAQTASPRPTSAPQISEAQALATSPSEAANLANTAGVLLRATQVESDDVR